jgi:formate C-acetyltransferase
MRLDAVHCHGWGDGNEDSSSLANRFNNDLYEICSRKTGMYGGKVNMGHLTYTEIRWWGEKTLATPDGRRNGDYFSQGITPSRLHQIDNVTAVLNSTKALHNENCSGNSVINIILPSDKLTLDGLEAFLRATAQSGVQSLQLNCVTKEQLLEAQKNPEKHKDIIVRVTGFSARFTSLSKGWQDEFISRNFYQ